jgi:hypothetical protein
MAVTAIRPIVVISGVLIFIDISCLFREQLLWTREHYPFA